MNLQDLNIDRSWTIFIDRDGVINSRLIDDYVKSWSEFHFEKGVQDAFKLFNRIFGNIVIVTNQQGIGKGLMTENDLQVIHKKMKSEIENRNGRIDKIYYCPNLDSDNSIMRKPNPGMALRAKQDIKDIDFEKSIMVGDSISDMKFGKSLNMCTIFISEDQKLAADNTGIIDFIHKDLYTFAVKLQINN